MILQKEIEIKINSKTFLFYQKLIPNLKCNFSYKIDVNDLHKGSHIKILVCCDICEKELYKPYRQYLESFNKRNIYCCSPICAQLKNKKTNIEKYGVENVFQSDKIKRKIISTNKEKYDVSYPSQSKDIREKIILSNKKNFGFDNPGKSPLFKLKIKNTCLLKYGTNNYNSSEISKEKRISKKLQVPDYLKSEFELYQKNVRNATLRIKKILYDNWDGFDFYDKEYIKNNFNLPHHDKKYPTIDHKISIYWGFILGIDFSLISNINNLCITKRCINSIKNRNYYIDERDLSISSLIALEPNSFISLVPTPAKFSFEITGSFSSMNLFVK